MAIFGAPRGWGTPRRWFLFHWINALCILYLLPLGLIIVYRENLGLTGIETKYGLIRLHAIVGYVFLFNLSLRFILPLLRSPSRWWRSIARRWSFSKNYLTSIASRKKTVSARQSNEFVLVAIYFLLANMMISGLFLAGNDLLFPPLGGTIAKYVVRSDVEVEVLLSANYSDRRNYVDTERNKVMKKIKRWPLQVHKYFAYALILVIVLHVILISVILRNRKTVH